MRASLNYAKKKTTGYVRSVDNTLSPFEIRVMTSKNVLLHSLRIEKQIKALELRLTGRDVLAILPTGIGKLRVKCVNCFVW